MSGTIIYLLKKNNSFYRTRKYFTIPIENYRLDSKIKSNSGVHVLYIHNQISEPWAIPQEYIDFNPTKLNKDYFIEQSIKPEIYVKETNLNPCDNKSYNIVLHFHGGGFVSGSPSSHETYLRQWANQSDVLIYSVDYSLAPEYMYPVAFNECYFVYKWLVQTNISQINPLKIILIGDSAGGNLAMAVALKAIEEGIRKPDAILMAYPALDCTKQPTPSRLLFSNDILIPYYILEVCLDSYINQSKTNTLTDYFTSPLYAPDYLLKQLPDDIVFMSASFDPLLDDTVRFLRRLDSLDKSYIFEKFDCPHGFLNLDFMLPEAQKSIELAGNFIKCIIDPEFAQYFQIKNSKLKYNQKTHIKLKNQLHSYDFKSPKTFLPLEENLALKHAYKMKKKGQF